MNAQAKSKTPDGEIAATTILNDWKGDFVADACLAATHLGLLCSGGPPMLSYDRAMTILRFHFDFRKIDDSHWSTVYQSFQNGRSELTTNDELRKRFLPPIASNDNTKDDSINAKTLLGMDFAPL